MSIKTKEYGIISGMNVTEYEMVNCNGMTVCVLDYGCIIKNILVNDKNGNKTDVVLGQASPEAYAENPGYLGAAIGRYANRLANGKVVINGKEYNVGINDGDNSLHGGIVGFDKKVWNAEIGGTDAEPVLKLTMTSPDGEEGYPGNLDVTVTYTITKDNELVIHYEGVTDADTLMNMTNHSYFNLGGHKSGLVDNHVLTMNCSFYTPNNSECMPTGEILSVEGTGFDFRGGKKLGDGFNASDEQIKMFGGFDHNFVIDGAGMRKASVLVNEETGIAMDTYTDKPGVQIYTCNAMDEGMPGKDGAVYGVHKAICLETQLFPNAVKNSHFPSAVLKAGDKYDTTTIYKFYNI